MAKSNKIIKSKTLRDHLNGKSPNQKLMKALKIGQTKVKDGKTYVVKLTPSGKLDWRIVKQKKSIKIKTADELFETDDFPSLDDVKEISDLGGSTGAKLVEDSNGRKFVMKKGNSQEHIEEEYTANSIYKLFGVNVPNMKLYKGQGESTILSDFMPETIAANDIMDEQTRDDIADHYVLDCLLSNWDIYKNDNILINTDDGEIIRVDNGGALRFSAQGRPKGDFFADEVDELDSMALHNTFMAEGLTDAKIGKQIKKILIKGENIISLIENEELKEKMYNRLMDLKDVVSDDPKDPYRELKEREIKKALRRSGSITNTGENGWSFLSEICKMRDFDKPPTVLEDDEFDLMLEDEDTLMLNRGLTGSHGTTAKKFMTDFATGDNCYYGTLAMYGAGIYAAVNSNKNNKGKNDDYAIALDYAGGYKENVMDIIIPADANTIEARKLDEMMNEEFFGEEFKDKKKEYDKAAESYNDLLKQKERIEDEIDYNVKQEMGWNEKTFDILRNSKPEEVYADTSKFSFSKVLNYYEAIIGSINGKIQKLDDVTYEVTLPNSSAKFLLNSFTSDWSLKQKNENSTPYNYHYKRLKDFIVKNHYSKIKGVVKKEIDKQKTDNPKMVDINTKIKASEKTVKSLSDEIQDLRKNGSSNVTNDVIAEIIKHPGGTYRGFYAAIKGYDAIINKNGWGTNTDFAIILNRSKMFVRDFK